MKVNAYLFQFGRKQRKFITNGKEKYDDSALDVLGRMHVPDTKSKKVSNDQQFAQPEAKSFPRIQNSFFPTLP